MKLTKEMRESMIDDAMSAAFGKREKAHEKATTALADAVYEHAFAAIEKLANKLPQGWCVSDSSIVIDSAGFGWRNGLKPNSLRMSKAHRTPRYQGSNPVKIGGDHPLFEQAQAVAEEFQAIKRDREALRSKLRAILYSVTTVPRLLEAWPECERYLPTNTHKSTSLVPVELVPELNAALGLKARRAA